MSFLSFFLFQSFSPRLSVRSRHAGQFSLLPFISFLYRFPVGVFSSFLHRRPCGSYEVLHSTSPGFSSHHLDSSPRLLLLLSFFSSLFLFLCASVSSSTLSRKLLGLLRLSGSILCCKASPLGSSFHRNARFLPLSFFLQGASEAHFPSHPHSTSSVFSSFFHVSSVQPAVLLFLFSPDFFFFHQKPSFRLGLRIEFRDRDLGGEKLGILRV